MLPPPVPFLMKLIGLWGSAVLYSICHELIFTRASTVDRNQYSNKNSCQNRELNAFTDVLSEGFPDRPRPGST
jgi:hypothetical protein